LKTCTKCKETKPLDGFNRRKHSKDGRTPSCKACLQKRRKQIRIEGPGQCFPTLTSEQKRDVYTSVILRMNSMGIASEETAKQMLARVGEV
jgi:hypothetical protein